MAQEKPLSVVKSEPLPAQAPAGEPAALTVVKSEPIADNRSRLRRAVDLGLSVAGMTNRNLPTTVSDATALAPSMGGVAGGLLGGFSTGGPGSVGGAALGGASGESFRQLINRLLGEEAPTSALEAAGQIATEGAIQGATEGAGRVLATGARVAGRALVENAVRPTIKLAREFPSVIDTIIKERLPVGRLFPWSQSGSQMASGELKNLANHVKLLLQKAGAAGKEYQPADLMNPVLDLVDDITSKPRPEADLKQLGEMFNEFFRSHPGPLTPLAVKELKQNAQAMAAPVFRAEATGQAVTPAQSLGARFDRAIASGSRQALETIPGVREGERATQQMIGASRAISQAELRRLSLMAELAAPAVAGVVGTVLSEDGLSEGLKRGAVSYLAVRGLMSPRTMSRAGLSLTSAQLQELFKQFPRLALEVSRRLGVAEPDP